jgi:uncharacterized membrane protein (DUF106 family)
MTFIQNLLTPIFEPLLKFSPIAAIAIISFAIALMINIVYKLMTDQKLMKELKDDIKGLQNEMKKYKEHPAKMMETQKRAMEKNMKYMGHSMKPTLITLLPLIVIFGWLNANLAFEPIAPGEEFTITMEFDKAAVGNAEIIVLSGVDLLDSAVKPVGDPATWTLKGPIGEHLVEWRVAGKTYTKEVLISNKHEYSAVEKRINDNNVETITVNNDKKVVMKIFNWELGWLGAYIIFSIVFSMITRKVMGLH